MSKKTRGSQSWLRSSKPWRSSKVEVK